MKIIREVQISTLLYRFINGMSAEIFVWRGFNLDLCAANKFFMFKMDCVFYVDEYIEMKKISVRIVDIILKVE